MKRVASHFLIPQEPYPCAELTTFSSRQNASEQEGQRFFWARNAVYHALRALKLSPGGQVLLPAYLCNTAVEPVLAYGMDVQFYAIDRRCRADFKEIESKIGSRTEAVLAVHYFGFPQDMRTFRELCDRHRIALLEDCAHTLTRTSGDTPFGKYGDASIFSWRKFLPVHDGGELRLKGPHPHVEWKKETLSFSARVLKDQIDRILDGSASVFANAVRTTLALAKKGWTRLNSSAATASELSIERNSASFDLSFVNLRMSRISRWMLDHSDLDQIIERRRQNYLYVQAGLRSIDGVALLHSELPPTVCPWVFPAVFEGLTGVHRLLREQGIPATAWDFVRPKGVDPDVFADADFLYDNLTFLPIHQNLTRKSLDLIIDAARRIRATLVPSSAEQSYAAR